MISGLDIARWRLRNQRLVQPHAHSVPDAVRALLAVQAENQQQSTWAVESRADDGTYDVAAALADGSVLRTHVLRPTWHYVAAQDLGWLLDLTAPRVLVPIDRQLADHDITPSETDRIVTAAADAVTSDGHLTRDELDDALRERGFEPSRHALMLLLARAELDGVLCSGEPRDGVHTYALLRERVPAPRRLDRDEALAELALRYFAGHGPATERDLAYWATLTLGDVRRALDLAREALDSFEHDGRTFWHAPGEPPTEPGHPSGHLLQVLDEMYRGYQDSRWMLDVAVVVPRGRESAIGMALVDSQLVAAMEWRSLDQTRV